MSQLGDHNARSSVMPDSVPTRQRVRILLCIVAIGVLLLAGVLALIQAEWYLSVFLAAVGIMMLLRLGRPLFRAAVYRTSEQEITCRLIPWYQANTLAAALMFPVMGASLIAAGRAPGNPAWLGYAGYFILIFGAVIVLFALLTWIFNLLSITPSELTIRTLRRRRSIPRDHVQAITPRMLPSGVYRDPKLHVDLTYVPDGDGQSSRTMALLDTQVSVDPANLAAALEMWTIGSPNDRHLMASVEAILRGSRQSRE